MKKKIEEELEQLLLEQYQKYYRLAYQYVGNEQDALDMVQESAYRAMKEVEQLRDGTYLDTWVYRIVINTCKDFLRKRHREIQESCLESSYPELNYEDCYQDGSLKELLLQLHPQERSIVLLRYAEELKLEQIAEIMGENTNTIKTKLYRTLRKLRRRFGEDIV